VFHLESLFARNHWMSAGMRVMLERRYAGFPEQCDMAATDGGPWTREEEESVTLKIEHGQRVVEPPDWSKTFPRELFDELPGGRESLRQIEQAHQALRLQHEKLLAEAIKTELNVLAPFAHTVGELTHVTTEIDFVVDLPGWPPLRVRYGLRAGQ